MISFDTITSLPVSRRETCFRVCRTDVGGLRVGCSSVGGGGSEIEQRHCAASAGYYYGIKGYQ